MATRTTLLLDEGVRTRLASLNRALPDVPMARPDVNSALSRDEIETMAQPKTCIRAAPDIVDNVLRVRGAA